MGKPPGHEFWTWGHIVISPSMAMEGRLESQPSPKGSLASQLWELTFGKHRDRIAASVKMPDR